ncbi:hypothetical protein THAOC_20355 [Thalassiosira oceanica]|uniref:Uncharacterized protein n=1 Tax=Thalassiosira oceanica TaxID=159749 RepID=K0S2E3_THAOC|nr:hypothetical protein THAOC_20355 [Thalassiosira oceanica]|eukprot:EJK59425.1 hypothetical protein THAOC_20355 [Thalassiosira oceanica]
MAAPAPDLVEFYQTPTALWTESDALLNQTQLVQHTDTNWNMAPATLKDHIGRQNGGAAIMMAMSEANDVNPGGVRGHDRKMPQEIDPRGKVEFSLESAAAPPLSGPNCRFPPGRHLHADFYAQSLPILALSSA